MEQSEFAALGQLADEADEKAKEWLQSESLFELRAALEKAIASLPDEYQVSLDVTLRCSCWTMISVRSVKMGKSRRRIRNARNVGMK